MKENPILKEKWRVQREIAREANHDVDRYMELVDKYATDWATANGVSLHYADVSKLPSQRLKIAESHDPYNIKPKARRG
jgi:hypothetical protein